MKEFEAGLATRRPAQGRCIIAHSPKTDVVVLGLR